MELTLKLTVEEVNAVLSGLGETPNKSGFFPLAIKIKEQAEAQLPKDEPKTE